MKWGLAMSTSSYTSADKLHEILTTLMYPSDAADLFNHQLCDRFARFFGCSSSDHRTISNYYAKTLELASSVKLISKSIGGRTAVGYEANIDEIIDALLSIGAYNHISGLDDYNERLKNGIALAGLKKLADYIADHNIEIDVDGEEITLIQEQLMKLISDVKNSSIDVSLKKKLLVNLNNVYSSVQEYNYFGITAINDAVEKTTGQLMLDVQRVEQTEENITMARQVLEKMRDFNTVCTFTATLLHALPMLVFEGLQRLSGG